MHINVAIQMDPFESLNIQTDSTLALAACAQERGYTLWSYHPRSLGCEGNQVFAHAAPFHICNETSLPHHLDTHRTLDLRDMDVVLLRQDPPFDMSYITTTYLLDLIHPDTLVVNNPTEVRNAPEKLFLTRFPELMPPTLISSDLTSIQNFREQHKDIILKPLYGNGGFGVLRLKPDDENLGSLIDLFKAHSSEPLVIQRYLPEVRQGDKRIILVDGEPVGALNRIPMEGDVRSNMHAGGRAEPTSLTPQDRHLCATIGPTLKEKGLIFVGIDVIGSWMTEVNVTSPTGIQTIRSFSGIDIASLIWNAIEQRLEKRCAKAI